MFDEKETLKKTRKFLEKLEEEIGVPKKIKEEAKELLKDYPYPGKVDLLYRDQ
jgi:DNA-binding NtrC family response regulator